MKTITIDGEKFVKLSDVPKMKPLEGDASNPYLIVGNDYFIQTVTHYYTGRLVWIGHQEIAVEQAAWIADTGRFHQFMSGEMANEVELYGNGTLLISRGSIVSMIKRKLIFESK